MILLDTLESLLEGIYLGEGFADKVGQANILVNPTSHLEYIIGKTIIINMPGYNPSFLKILQSNRNNIISRVYRKDISQYNPYITRVNFGIMWNGRIMKAEKRNVLDWLWEINGFDVDNPGEPKAVYFPKVIDVKNNILYDEKNHLTCLGWVLHQVGMNLDKNTRFFDLDVIKTKKKEVVKTRIG